VAQPATAGAGFSGSERRGVAVPLDVELKTDLKGKTRTFSEDGKSAAPNPSLPLKGRPPGQNSGMGFGLLVRRQLIDLDNAIYEHTQ